MERTYTYENAIIHIFIPDENSLHIREATEKFMRKVLKERESNHDNFNKTKRVSKK